MKITYRKSNKVNLKVESISLLTVEEAKRLPEMIRGYMEWWWLRSPGGDSLYSTYVYTCGFIPDGGYHILSSAIAVRPVLTIENLRFLNLKIGESLIIKKKKYRYIGGDKALYDDKVVYHRFDGETNDYEKSEVKQVVDKWFKRRKKEVG